jgi:PAS domain S-box-containing protein
MTGSLVLAHRSVLLEPVPESARRARGVATDVLRRAHREDLVDIAGLLVSEVVTNAILHGRSEIALTVTATTSGVHVKVADRSPNLPAPRSYDEGATTGRGLELIQVLADDWGVQRVGETGKVVWFTLGPSEQAAPQTLTVEEGRTSRADSVTVTLLQLPAALYRAFQQQADAVLREYLLALASDTGADPSHHDQLAFAKETLELLAAGAAPVFADRRGAKTVVDVMFSVPLTATVGFAVLRTVLDRAMEMAADGELLVRPSQPEIVALQNWCCDQVLQQASGGGAERWQPSDTDVRGPSVPAADWDTAPVSESAHAVVAADDSNRLIAVSAAAADLLGWPTEELVGRRIVTIVPERLREAHIAGFTGHLVTGETRIIGTPTLLPALRRDGTEITIKVLLEAAHAPHGRRVFVAWLHCDSPPSADC